ncbi:hypothetical protein AB0D07_33955, partial [Streptomyces globisporus]
MNTNDPVATPAGQQRDPTTALGGASYRVRRSYGPSYALAPAQEWDLALGTHQRALIELGYEGVSIEQVLEQ